MKRDEVQLSRRILILILGAALVQISWGGETNPSKESFVVRFALSASVVEADVNPDDALAATKIWAATLGKGMGTWTKSDATIFRDLKGLAMSVNNEDIDIVAIASNEYLELEGSLRAEPALVYMQSGQVGIEYVVIVRQDSGLKTIADLRGKRIAMAKGGRNIMASLWLDALMADNHLPVKESVLREIKEVTKTSQVVLPVFFKQIDAGVVIKLALETAVALNPQIGQQVKIIATSPRLITQVTCFRTSLPSKTKALYLEKALKLHETPSGLQTFNVFRLERLLPWDPSYLDNVRELMKKQKLAISSLQGQNRPNASAFEGAQ